MKSKPWKILVVLSVLGAVGLTGPVTSSYGQGLIGGGKEPVGGGGGAPAVQAPRVAAPPANVAPRVAPPAVNAAPRVAPPAVNAAPRVAPNANVAPRVAPNVNAAPRVAPNVNVAPRVAPNANVAPRVAPPNVNVAPRVAPPNVNVAPRVTPPNVNVAPNANVAPRVNVPGVNVPGVNVPGARVNAGAGAGVNVGGGNGLRIGTNVVPSINNRVGVALPSLGGTNINLGRQSVNLAVANYRPSYARYPWYRGFWGFGFSTGNWAFGFGPGYGWGYGPGYGWGYGGGPGWWGWGGGYWGRPIGWGLGAWGLGGLAYGSGYVPYMNPYYGGGGGGVYDYSQPIPVNYASVGDTSPSEDMLNQAIAAFRRTEYDAALGIVNQAIAQHPDDAVLHEFRALVFFAKGDYQQAAGTIHSVLAVGPGWNWETVRTLYSDAAVYTAQLRALEKFMQDHPDDAASRFLLAYHYMIGGHTDAAARYLQQVATLQPNDRVATDLLRMLTTPKGSQMPQGAAPLANSEQPTPRPPQEPQQPPQAPQPPAERPAAPKIDATALVGTWKASRDDGSEFALTLTEDSRFAWKFSHKQTTQELSGKYTVEGNVLALERKEGGSLVGQVTPDGNGKFNFKLVGGPKEDPGLNFTHGS